MQLELSSNQAEALSDLLRAALGDLSFEIAATDNPTYRLQLVAKRDRLSEVAQKLEHPETTVQALG